MITLVEGVEGEKVSLDLSLTIFLKGVLQFLSFILLFLSSFKSFLFSEKVFFLSIFNLDALPLSRPNI